MSERWREILAQLSEELERQSAKLEELNRENQQLRGANRSDRVTTSFVVKSELPRRGAGSLMSQLGLTKLVEF